MTTEQEILAAFRALPKGATLTPVQILRACPGWNPSTPAREVRRKLSTIDRLTIVEPARPGLAERWGVVGQHTPRSGMEAASSLRSES